MMGLVHEVLVHVEALLPSEDFVADGWDAIFVDVGFIALVQNTFKFHAKNWLFKYCMPWWRNLYCEVLLTQ